MLIRLGREGWDLLLRLIRFMVHADLWSDMRVKVYQDLDFRV